MRDSLARVLQSLVRERETLRESERQLAKREQQMVDSLRQLLPRMGYKIVATAGPGRPSTRRDGVQRSGKPKRIPCPQCDRMFAHPLPLARHMSATHGVKKTSRKSSQKAAKKAR